MIPAPVMTEADYISYMVSPYNIWFRDLGYPELDIVEYEDGEWAIIQYLRSPVVPCLTPWNHVLTKLRHVEKSYWVCKKWAEQLDLEKRHVWEQQEASERRAREEQAFEDRRAEDWATQAFTSIRNNPGLMERIAKNGLGEIGLRQLARHIPNHHYRKDSKKCSTTLQLARS